jgi:DNA-binding beta-propeller fold protein YncE
MKNTKKNQLYFCNIRKSIINYSNKLFAVWFLFALVQLSGCVNSGFFNQDPGLTEKKVLPVWPAPPQQPRIQYLTSFSTPSDLGIRKSWLKRTIETVFGDEEVQEILLRPYGIFVTDGKIYVTDPGTRILHIFDSNAGGYSRIKDAGDEEFQSPIGVAVDKNGDIYITDSMLRKVFVFNREGKYLRQIGSPDAFLRPAGIAIDNERVYIIDTHAHHVLVFSKEGRHLFSFGVNGSKKGEFNFPTNIFRSKEGLLYITDSMNFRVQIFDRDGKFIYAFGKPGDGSGDLSKPKGIAVDSDGQIYVADAQFDAVQIYNSEGKLLLGFGNTGSNIGQMVLPAGVFIDDTDRIYVADSYNHRIQIFQYLKVKK